LGFGYFLSAFLSAGRSVTFALQFEQKDDYDAWYVGWESGLGADDRKLWKEMNAHRVEEVHRDGAKTAVEIEMVPMIEMARENPLPAHLTHFGWFGENKVGLPVRYFEFEGTKVKAVEMCRRYVDLLDKLVQDFLKAHAEPTQS
jgi:hypothetical protein